jgi:uncharacterized protein YydD (DUF2326 family)
MYIKELLITRGSGEIIRSIQFHAGINLIVDDTPMQTGKETGNSVGKTTVLKLIDFCLGGDAKNIYSDSENQKNEYTIVKDFLIRNSIIVRLTLLDDLRDEESRRIVIERNFCLRSDKIQRIDNQSMTDDEFKDGLTKILFPERIGKKPTFRQIISHNIRYSNQSLENTLLTLDRYTKDIEYASLYLFLFGCEFDKDDTKLSLTKEIVDEEKFKNKLESEQTLSAYEGALSILNDEISKLEKEKSLVTIRPDFDTDLNRLNEVKYKINQTSSNIASLNLRRKLIIESEEEMRSKISNVNTTQLKQIYSQATALLDNVQKSFEELVVFHNKMIQSKIDFISKDLPNIDKELSRLKNALQELMAEEKLLNVHLFESANFGDFEEIVLKLNSAYEKKGEYEAIISKIKNSELHISGLREKLSDIDSVLFSDGFRNKLQQQVSKFSIFFSQVSSVLYGEKYALQFEEHNYKGKRVYKFSAFNTNFSSGKKQGEISCFDIAYTMFADSEKIPCMHFLLNDKKELMHDNQLINIADYVNKNDIQFVASILKDKLPQELQDDKNIIIRLSQDDKLFRIEKRYEKTDIEQRRIYAGKRR